MAYQPHHPSVLQKLRGLKLPAPGQASVAYSWPGQRPDNASAGAQNGVIYDPDRILDASGRAHEMFHLLDQQNMTDADRGRLQMMLGRYAKGGTWDQGTGMTESGLHSPSEVAADWFSALVSKTDPHRGWAGAYADEAPSRRELLRFGRSVERMMKRYHLKPYTDPKK